MVVSAEALQPRSTGVTASVSGVSRPYSEASTNATDSTAVFSADQLDQLENLDLPNVSVSDGGGSMHMYSYSYGAGFLTTSRLQNSNSNGRALRVLFLSADTGGGHRASAEALARQVSVMYV